MLNLCIKGTLPVALESHQTSTQASLQYFKLLTKPTSSSNPSHQNVLLYSLDRLGHRSRSHEPRFRLRHGRLQFTRLLGGRPLSQRMGQHLRYLDGRLHLLHPKGLWWLSPVLVLLCSRQLWRSYHSPRRALGGWRRLWLPDWQLLQFR